MGSQSLGRKRSRAGRGGVGRMERVLGGEGGEEKRRWAARGDKSVEG